MDLNIVFSFWVTYLESEGRTRCEKSTYLGTMSKGGGWLTHSTKLLSTSHTCPYGHLCKMYLYLYFNLCVFVFLWTCVYFYLYLCISIYIWTCVNLYFFLNLYLYLHLYCEAHRVAFIPPRLARRWTKTEAAGSIISHCAPVLTTPSCSEHFFICAPGVHLCALVCSLVCSCVLVKSFHQLLCSSPPSNYSAHFCARLLVLLNTNVYFFGKSKMGGGGQGEVSSAFVAYLPKQLRAFP